MVAFPQKDTHKSGVSLKVTECLEQNIRKQIGYKRLSRTKQMNRVDYKIFVLNYANRSKTR